MIYYLYCTNDFYQSDFFSFHKFYISSCGFFFPLKKVLFNISYQADLVDLNSFGICLCVKLFISLSELNDSLIGYSILGCRFFHHFECMVPIPSSLQFLLKSAEYFTEVPLHISSLFYLAAFKSISSS